MDSFSVFPQSESVVMVHKGWREMENSKGNVSPRNDSHQPRVGKVFLGQPGVIVKGSRASPATPQKFEFVNGTTPFANRDPHIRKLVRAHVVRDSTRRKKQTKELKTTNEKKTSNRPSRTRSLSNNTSSISLADETIFDGDEQASATPNSSRSSRSPILPSLGLDPNPQLSPIIYLIITMGNAMWPLEDSVRFNPISPARWFDWALSDEALFHALLYSTTTYAGLISGTTESKDGIVHESRAMSLVNQRISHINLMSLGRNGESVDEGTIGAVTCLAITAALCGNFEGWNVHMMGIKQMVDMKGGMSELSLTLQLKIHRADLTGSADYLAAPFFAEHNQLPIHSAHSTSMRQGSPSLLKFLNSLPIDRDLVNSLIILSNFSHELSLILSNPAVASIPSQNTLLEETYALRYSLLKSASLHQPVFVWPSESDQMLVEVLCVGALLYMQATLQEFPYSAVGSTNLVNKLKDSVMLIKIRNQQEGELMVWLLFMGGIEARSAEDRSWFVAQIGKLVGRLRLRTWEAVKSAMEWLWWVDKIHEERCRNLWGEVELRLER